MNTIATMPVTMGAGNDCCPGTLPAPHKIGG
jgi:hypothetical protein